MDYSKYVTKNSGKGRTISMANPKAPASYRQKKALSACFSVQKLGKFDWDAKLTMGDAGKMLNDLMPKMPARSSNAKL
jgi:hypothetical protein